MDGIINVYKEAGYTSHDVVAKLRGILKMKKIGHTGTLDPEAVGVLPVCIGNATKLCDLIMEKQKVYLADFMLGVETDTQDDTGRILSTSDAYNDLDENTIVDVINCFVGEYDQLPPMYSALKVNGQKLCDLARNGIEVERKTRRVVFYNIQVTKIELPYVQIRVTCSKGTYIRTLCHDIGKKLGCGACMTHLVREASGDYKIENSFTLDRIEDSMRRQTILEDGILLSTDSALQKYEILTVRETFSNMLKNGNCLSMDAFEQTWEFSRTNKEINEMVPASENGWYRVYDQAGKFTAVYEYQPDTGIYKPVKIFLNT